VPNNETEGKGKKVGILVFFFLRIKRAKAARMMHSTQSGGVI
jgi:hypothetical protein